MADTIYRQFSDIFQCSRTFQIVYPTAAVAVIVKEILVVRSVQICFFFFSIFKHNRPHGIGTTPKLLIFGCSNCKREQLVSICGRNYNFVANNSNTTLDVRH